MIHPESKQSHRSYEKMRKAFLAGVNAYFDVLVQEDLPVEEVARHEGQAPDRPDFDHLRDREMADYLRTVWDACVETGAKVTHKYYAKKMVDAGYDKYDGFKGEKRSGSMVFKARHDDVLKEYLHPFHL